LRTRARTARRASCTSRIAHLRRSPLCTLAHAHLYRASYLCIALARSMKGGRMMSNQIMGGMYKT